MKRLKILILLILLTHKVSFTQDNSDFTLTNEITKSVYLNLEAISILDSVAEIVWPSWNTYYKHSFFIGSPNNNAVFINPHNDIPKNFVQYDSIESKNKIFVREHSGLSTNYNGTIIELDGKYFRLIRMTAFDENLNHYYTKRLSEFLENKEQKNRIQEVVRSPEYYISIITHETFHFHQKNKKITLYYKTVEPRYYKKSKVLAYSYIEGMLLKKALYCSNEKETKSIVRQFIAIRKKKGSFLSKRQQIFEKVDEFQEGTAQYIQTQIQLTLNELDFEPTNNYLSNTSLTFNNASDFLYLDSLCMEASIIDTKGLGHKHYFYGQTQARILDKLSGDKWKVEIMNENIFLIDLLAKYSEYKPLNSNYYLKQVQETYDFNFILRKIRKIRFRKEHYIRLNEKNAL